MVDKPCSQVRVKPAETKKSKAVVQPKTFKVSRVEGVSFPVIKFKHFESTQMLQLRLGYRQSIQACSQVKTIQNFTISR